MSSATSNRGMATSTRGYKKALFAKWADRAAELDEAFYQEWAAELDEAFYQEWAAELDEDFCPELDDPFYKEWAAELDEAYYKEWDAELDVEHECDARYLWSPGYKACSFVDLVPSY